MRTFCLLVKSYRVDLEYATRLVASFNRHNVERLDLFLVVPDVDLPDFSSLQSTHVLLLPESTFASHLVDDDVAGFSAGYINQEIIKLCFWEAGLAANYLCLDSDAEFVRDFTMADFMLDEQTPYTFMSEDAELRVEPEYFRTHWQSREVKLRQIMDEIGLDEPRLLTAHGHAVFSATVLEAFKQRFLEPRGWDYVDALAIAPYEPSWYTFWLQKDKTIPIVMREPIIKVFHNATQQLDYVLRGVQTEDVARGYVALVVNSNYSRSEGMPSLADAPETALSSFVTAGELVRAIGFRINRTLFIEKVPYRRARTALGAGAARVPWLRRFVDLGG